MPRGHLCYTRQACCRQVHREVVTSVPGSCRIGHTQLWHTALAMNASWCFEVLRLLRFHRCAKSRCPILRPQVQPWIEEKDVDSIYGCSLFVSLCLQPFEELFAPCYINLDQKIHWCPAKPWPEAGPCAKNMGITSCWNQNLDPQHKTISLPFALKLDHNSHGIMTFPWWKTEPKVLFLPTITDGCPTGGPKNPRKVTNQP